MISSSFKFKKIFFIVSLINKSYKDLIPSLAQSLEKYINTLSYNNHKISLHITIIDHPVKIQKNKKPLFTVQSEEELTFFKESLKNVNDLANNWLTKFENNTPSYNFWTKIQKLLENHSNVIVQYNEHFQMSNKDWYLNTLLEHVTPLQKNNISFNIDSEITYIKLTANTSMKAFEDPEKEYIFLGQSKEEINAFLTEQKETKKNTKDIKPVSLKEDQKKEDDFIKENETKNILEEEKDNIDIKIENANKEINKDE